MSQLYDIREALAASIADAGIFPSDAILIKRQTDLFNDIATALATATNGACLHIGVAEGKSTEEDGLEMEITVPLTILCEPVLREGDTPEEDLWEMLVKHVHDLRLKTADPYSYRFRFKSFGDLPVEDNDGTAYLGRQTVFAYQLSL